jgi:hypothetical protein
VVVALVHTVPVLPKLPKLVHTVPVLAKLVHTVPVLAKLVHTVPVLAKLVHTVSGTTRAVPAFQYQERLYSPRVPKTNTYHCFLSSLVFFRTFPNPRVSRCWYRSSTPVEYDARGEDGKQDAPYEGP